MTYQSHTWDFFRDMSKKELLYRQSIYQRDLQENRYSAQEKVQIKIDLEQVEAILKLQA